MAPIPVIPIWLPPIAPIIIPVVIGGGIIAGVIILGNAISDDLPGALLTPDQEVEKQLEYENYKNICNQQPPPNLDKCEEARWQLRKAKQCRDLRQAWDDRWFPGRHAQEIKNWNRRVKNLEKWIEKNCEGCDAKES